MQELVQITEIEEPLTFEDICPDFNMLILEHGWDGVKGSKSYTIDGKQRALKNAMCCIVGESHGG